MHTVVETPSFAAEADRLWSDEERGLFCTWIAANPNAGAVVSGSGGCRKVRWSLPGQGKSGGVRVIYFVRTERGEIWLLAIYAKSVRGSIPGQLLRKIREEVERE